jgi:pseudouridine-5'-phosphate glycosidase
MNRLATITDHLSVLTLSDEVASAIKAGKAIVALESTILTHGMAFPDNVACCRLVERAVREHGAVPATIAILGGKIHVGLSDGQIEFLGKKGHDVIKCSRRDLAVVCARKLFGSTTVSCTMMIAKMAGLKVFVTGGCERKEIFLSLFGLSKETKKVSEECIEMLRLM